LQELCSLWRRDSIGYFTASTTYEIFIKEVSKLRRPMLKLALILMLLTKQRR